MSISVKRTLHPLLIVGIMSLGSGCESSPAEPPPPPKATGFWTGLIIPDNFNFEVTLVEDEAGVLTGSGRFFVTGGSIAFSAQGVHAHPSLSFTISAAGAADANYSGSLETDTFIRGRINGSGFNNNELNLTKN